MSPESEQDGPARVRKTCPKCGSEHIAAGLTTDLRAHIGKGLLSNTSTGFTASVCTACGYTEFYATNPEGVWREWRKLNA